MRSRRAVGAGAVLAALLAMTGCTAAASDDASSEPTVAVPTPGTSGVSAEEAAAAEAAGLEVYTASDGTLTVVDPAQPFPAEVVADLESIAGDLGSTPSSTEEAEAISARLGEADQAALAAGKTPIYIIASGAFDIEGNLLDSFYLATWLGMPPSPTLHDSAAAALAYAEDFLSTVEDPARYEIIDLTD